MKFRADFVGSLRNSERQAAQPLSVPQMAAHKILQITLTFTFFKIPAFACAKTRKNTCTNSFFVFKKQEKFCIFKIAALSLYIPTTALYFVI
jgi:hypothetical protein